MRFRLGKCVWGPAYTDTMLACNLPSLLAPGNLPLVAARFEVEHVIYTTVADAPRIAADPIHRLLARTVPARIVEVDADGDLDALSYGSSIAQMNRIHNRMLKDCQRDGMVWLFDAPDAVWSDGSLGWLAEQAATDGRCVVAPSMRTLMERMRPALEAMRDANGVVAVSSRQLMALAAQNLHWHDATRFWGGDCSTLDPHYLSWPVGKGAFLRRAFYVQGFNIVPPEGVEAERSIDMHYLEQAYPDLSQLRFAENTDEFLVVEVSSRFHVNDENPARMTLPQLGAFAATQCSAYHRACFGRPVRFHSGGVSERAWRRIEVATDRLARAVELRARLHRLSHDIAREWPLAARLVATLLRDPDLAKKAAQWAEPSVVILPAETALAALDWEALKPTPAQVACHLLSVLPSPGQTPRVDGGMAEVADNGRTLMIDGIEATPVGHIEGFTLLIARSVVGGKGVR